jgi:pimeloyl-ACP methyl ester carboxylesterase
MPEDFSSCYPEGTTADIRLYPVNDRVALHVVTFRPPAESVQGTVVLVGGLATVLDSLREIVYELSSDHIVHYLETREKSGSLITGKVSYDVESMGEDTSVLIGKLGLEDNRYLLMGYSMGATVVAGCYRRLQSRPKGMILLEPTPVFHYPAWSIPLIRYLGLPLYRILIPLSKAYLRAFRINNREDAEMAVISFRSIDHAEPRKLRNVILSIAPYTVWDKLPLIACPVLIVGTSRDHLHVKEETERMVRMIPNCRYTDLETNKRSHSAEMGKVVRDYAASLG